MDADEGRWANEIQNAAPFPDYMVIDGDRVAAGQRDRIETCDPGSGLLLHHVPAGTADDVNSAVDAARRALSGPWQSIPPRSRGRILWAIGERIRGDLDRIALIETLDSGKPLRDARASVERAADYFTYYAGLTDKLEGTSVPLGRDKVCFTERVPIGVTGHIVPWNVPLSMVARGLAPALACGNTAVVKPAEDTPFTAILLSEICLEAGVPPGVVNVVTGTGRTVGKALTEHPDVRHVTFTGSVSTGKTVMKAAAGHVASVTLELGGKSPHVILRDANLDHAVPDILNAVFKNAGQICSSGTRLLVERSIQDALIDRLTTKTSAMRLGHGLDNPDMGPLISSRQMQNVAGHIDRAKERGVFIVTGGEPASVNGCEGGFYFQPTIAAPLDADDELAWKEIFGPVLAVIPIEDLDHAIEVGNGTTFGLAAGIHTRDIAKAMRFAREIEAGQVYVNGYHGAGDTVPFGGMKQSGIGREKGMAGIEQYCEIKSVTVTIG